MCLVFILQDLHSRIVLTPEEQTNYLENGVKIFINLRAQGRRPKAQFSTNADVDKFNLLVSEQMG